MYGLFYNEEKIQLTRCYKSIDEVVKDEFGICDTQCWRFHEEIATDEEWKEFIEWLSNQKDFVVKRLELSVDCLDNNENDIQDLEDEFTTKYMREVRAVQIGEDLRRRLRGHLLDARDLRGAERDLQHDHKRRV